MTYTPHTPDEVRAMLTKIGVRKVDDLYSDIPGVLRLEKLDLPRGMMSGLMDAERILKDVKGISFSYFTADDVVRHPLVARIIKAYEVEDNAALARGETEEPRGQYVPRRAFRNDA